VLACQNPSLLAVPPNQHRSRSKVGACGRARRLDKQSQGGFDDLALLHPVADGTDGTAHQLRRDKHLRHLQPPSDMREGPDEDRDRGDTLLLQGPAEEADRPVADRSSGDEQAGVDSFGAQPLRPVRRRLLT